MSRFLQYVQRKDCLFFSATSFDPGMRISYLSFNLLKSRMLPPKTTA